MEFFLVAIVDGESREVRLMLFRAGSGAMLAEALREGGPPVSAAEQREAIRSAAGEIAAHLRRGM
jgi:hypothetical protein